MQAPVKRLSQAESASRHASATHFFASQPSHSHKLQFWPRGRRISLHSVRDTGDECLLMRVTKFYRYSSSVARGARAKTGASHEQRCWEVAAGICGKTAERLYYASYLSNPVNSREGSGRLLHLAAPISQIWWQNKGNHVGRHIFVSPDPLLVSLCIILYLLIMPECLGKLQRTDRAGNTSCELR